MIIGISGKIGTGKDTVGSIIKYWLNYADKGKAGSYSSYLLMDHWYNPDDWVIKKFADKLKQIASILTGVSLGKLEDRNFKNSYMPSCWNKVKQMTECDGDDGVDGYSIMPMTYRQFLQELGTEAIRNGLHENTWVNALMQQYDRNESNWIITDVRFPNEYKAIIEAGGIMIRVQRDGVKDTHPSETSLDHHQFDYTLYNSGDMEMLVKQVHQMLTFLKLIK